MISLNCFWSSKWINSLSTVLHTSASLALNESWDPDVRDDMEMMLNKIVPEGLEYRHSCEGPDDMVSCKKHSLFFLFVICNTFT